MPLVVGELRNTGLGYITSLRISLDSIMWNIYRYFILCLMDEVSSDKFGSNTSKFIAGGLSEVVIIGVPYRLNQIFLMHVMFVAMRLSDITYSQW